MVMVHNEIQELVLAFRAAILSIPSSQRPLGLSKFPSGACGDTSLLLGAYLNDLGEPGYSYAVGCRGSHASDTQQTHAWLQRQNLVIDLTCDQFNDAPSGFVFQNSSWHQQFREIEFFDADFRNWHGDSLYELGRFYSKIRSKL